MLHMDELQNYEEEMIVLNLTLRGTQGPEELSDLPKATQLASDRSEWDQSLNNKPTKF